MSLSDYPMISFFNLRRRWAAHQKNQQPLTLDDVRSQIAQFSRDIEAGAANDPIQILSEVLGETNPEKIALINGTAAFYKTAKLLDIKFETEIAMPERSHMMDDNKMTIKFTLDGQGKDAKGFNFAYVKTNSAQMDCYDCNIDLCRALVASNRDFRRELKVVGKSITQYSKFGYRNKRAALIEFISGLEHIANISGKKADDLFKCSYLYHSDLPKFFSADGRTRILDNINDRVKQSQRTLNATAAAVASIMQ